MKADYDFVTSSIKQTKYTQDSQILSAFCFFFGRSYKVIICFQNLLTFSCYQKIIGAHFTHLHIPSMCKEFLVMCHNLGHSNTYAELIMMRFFLPFLSLRSDPVQMVPSHSIPSWIRSKIAKGFDFLGPFTCEIFGSFIGDLHFKDFLASSFMISDHGCCVI